MFARLCAADPRNDGVRPVQIWGLRLFFFLMLVFVAPFAWAPRASSRARQLPRRKNLCI